MSALDIYTLAILTPSYLLGLGGFAFLARMEINPVNFHRRAAIIAIGVFWPVIFLVGIVVVIMALVFHIFTGLLTPDEDWSC